jgi:polyphosphate kinase
VDSEHPFPFISSGGLNLAVLLPDDDAEHRFVRIKVPGNRPRFVEVPSGGFCPLEQVIAANLDLVFPNTCPVAIHQFRVTRGAEGDADRSADLDDDTTRRPGDIVRQVTDELKARRFAGVVRVEVDEAMPAGLRKWLAAQFGTDKAEIFPTRNLLKLADLTAFPGDGGSELRFPPHTPVTHPRLRTLPPADTGAIFAEIRRGDLLLHHPYQSFDTSVLRLLESAANDPDVLAIKMTIYRTSGDSPIVAALAEAARRGKQVAVLVEINARFDEAPNIAWGRYLEKEGVHVSYGVERLKTHVKLMLVVREEGDAIRSYVHVGTGNYHTGTARVYEDLGILTCDPEICDDVAKVFIELTGATSTHEYARMLVAPRFMRDRFVEMIRREAEHAKHGRPAGITAKMNQLQDPGLIRELYRAGRAGVPILLIVRGLDCLRAGVPGLSENIRVVSVVGRFLEHSRIYHFVNGGDPEWYLGSADWMKRNLDRRVETIVPVLDEGVRHELALIVDTYERDNCSAWDLGADGQYTRREPPEGETPLAAQDWLIRRAQSRRSRAQAYRIRS